MGLTGESLVPPKVAIANRPLSEPSRPRLRLQAYTATRSG